MKGEDESENTGREREPVWRRRKVLGTNASVHKGQKWGKKGAYPIFSEDRNFERVQKGSRKVTEIIEARKGELKRKSENKISYKWERVEIAWSLVCR